jgi:YHS domain-containing protein
MKKVLLLTVAAMALATSALADPPKGKEAKKTPTEIKCAVMTESAVNIKDATKTKMFADYKGRRYFFCCGGCPAAFKKDPAKYAKAESIPTPKAVKKGKKG